MSQADSLEALEEVNHMRTSSRRDDHLDQKQPQRLMKFKIVSKLPKFPPTLSTFNCLASDSDVFLMERLRSHHEHMYTYSKWSTLLSFVLMRKLTLGFATILIPVSHSTLSLDDAFSLRTS